MNFTKPIDKKVVIYPMQLEDMVDRDNKCDMEIKISPTQEVIEID